MSLQVLRVFTGEQAMKRACDLIYSRKGKRRWKAFYWWTDPVQVEGVRDE